MIVLSEEKKRLLKIMEQCRASGKALDFPSLMFLSGQLHGMAYRYLIELENILEMLIKLKIEIKKNRIG